MVLRILTINTTLGTPHALPVTSGTRRAGVALLRCHRQERPPRTSTRALPGAPERTMELYDAIGIAFAAGLFVYLVYALFRPDKF